MGFLDTLLLKVGLVRIRRFGMTVSGDGSKLVPIPSDLLDAVAASTFVAPSLPPGQFIDLLNPAPPATKSVQPAAPPPLKEPIANRRVARGTTPPNSDEVKADEPAEDEEWAWKMAMARAKSNDIGEAPKAEESVDEDEEWEWKAAMAKARAAEPSKRSHIAQAPGRRTAPAAQNVRIARHSVGQAAGSAYSSNKRVSR